MAFSDKDIYKKGGKTNFREKKLINDLKEAIEKRIQKDPNFSFVPAENYQELKALHENFAIESAQFEETKTNDVESAHKQFRDAAKETIETDEAVEPDEPFTESNPEIRDYVMDNSSHGGAGTTYGSDFNFKEPTTDDEAFSFDDASGTEQKTNSQNSSGQPQPQQKKTDKKAPINPSYDDMDNAAKNKGAKQMAHFITEGGASAIKTIVTYLGTLNISDAKLASYELSGEYDLEREVDLVDGRRVTIKEFLTMQRMAIEEVAGLTEQEKSDLKVAIAEVLKEKKVAPTPTQNLMIILAGIAIRQVSSVAQIVMSNNAVLEQVRVKKPTPKQSYYKPPAHEQEAAKPKSEPVAPAPAPSAPKPPQAQANESNGDLSELTVDDFNTGDILTEEGITSKE